MANEIIKDELKDKKVYQWELAVALGISEQTMVRRMRFEMSEDKRWELLALINELAMEKEGYIDT